MDPADDPVDDRLGSVVGISPLPPQFVPLADIEEVKLEKCTDTLM